MNPRNLLAAAILLAALCGAVWWANKHPQTTETAGADKSAKVVDIAADTVQQITVKKKDGSVLTLDRSSGQWKITAPESLPADQDSVGGLTSALAPLTADSVIADSAANASQYGLSAPSLVVSVRHKDGKSDTISFGDDVPAGSLVYVQHASDPKIYAVSSTSKSSFDKSVNDLRDKRLLTFNSDKLTSMELTTPKTNVVFGKTNQGDWQIAKPAPYRADSFQVEDLLRKLQDARMDLSASAEDQKKIAADFASGQVIGTAKTVDASGPQTLEIKKNKDNYYAKSSVVQGIFKVSNDLGSGFDKTLDDFRNHKLFDFGFNDPTRLELRHNATDTVYQKSGQDWKQNGKTLDAATVQTVIDQLRDLSASKFAESGFHDPVAEVAVTSHDGKQTERVSFAKAGDDYLAKRDNEAPLYEVTGKTFDELLKNFGSIKPQAAASKK